jgi:DNA invertase Pin-like site-specific DNA recombinase
MRIAAYLSLGPGESRQIVEKQFREMQRLVRAQKGWKLIRKYSDSFSLANQERPSFRRLLSDAEKHRFEMLLFWSLDRFSQQGPLHSLRLLRRLSGWGIQYRSISEPHLDTSGLFGEAVSSVVVTLAAQERNHLVRRTRAGLALQQQSHRPGPKGRFGPGRPVLEINAEKLLALGAKNLDRDQIAAALGISPSTVTRRLKKIEEAAKP